MTDGPEWFAPKRYGYGAGLPISWQGWLITIVYVTLAAVVATQFRERPLVIAAILLPATALLWLIAARTTRGGWHWRWGKRD
jgi:hypothetical protein